MTISQTAEGTSRTLTAHALRPVAAGEELCISYSEAKLLDDAEARRTWLQRTYLFECQCVLCQAPPAEAREMAREFNRRYGPEEVDEERWFRVICDQNAHACKKSAPCWLCHFT